MPLRPRQHQVEDESRNAFRSLLPSRWVFRDVTPDYGIDGSVEIFDEHGKGTGRQFNVQLKATDNEDLTNALSISLPIDRCIYYEQLDSPTLIALYHAPTKTLYAKWFHEFVWHAARPTVTTTLKLTAADQWQSDTPSKIAEDVERIRRIKSAAIDLPLEFEVQYGTLELFSTTSARISLALRTIAAELPGLIVFSEQRTPRTLGTVYISAEHLKVDLSGVNSFTLDVTHGYSRESASLDLPKDITVLIALTLGLAGHFDLGARFLSYFGAQSTLIANDEIALRMARLMARAHRIEEALRLADHLISADRAPSAVQTLMISAVARSSNLSATDRQFVADFLIRYVEAAKRKANKVLLSTAYYNLGNYLRANRLFLAAFKAYRRAAKTDSSYMQRPYFLREMAGILFGLRKYKIAAALYKKAIGQGESGLAIGLYADSLLFSGSYVAAEQQFENYINSTSKPVPEFRLKRWASSYIQQKLGLSVQRREPLKAMSTFLLQNAPGEQLDTVIRRSLELDALSGIAWFNSAIISANADSFDEALNCFLMAALVQWNDVKAWSQAFLLAFVHKRDFSLAFDIASSAFTLNRENFVSQVLSAIEEQQQSFPKAEVAALLNGIVEEVKAETGDQPFEVRQVYYKQPPQSAG